MTKIGGPGSRLYERERMGNKYDAKAPQCFDKVPTTKPKRRCLHCRNPINKDDSYFQDIPSLGGDLCKPCHTKWQAQENL